MQYDNSNRGVLFRNDRKVEGDDSMLPDYTGSLDVGRQSLWINGWLRTSKTGSKYMSLSVKPKQDAKPAQRQTTRQDMRDEIPW